MGKWLVLFVAGLVVALLTAAPAAGMSEEGSVESLRVSALKSFRQAGESEKVTVEGVADGAHALYVYGEYGEAALKMHCPIERVTEPGAETHPGTEAHEETHSQWLSPSGGEALPAGHFVKTYEPIFEELPYLVCAYLYAPPARFPDAWEYGCFAKEANCSAPMTEPSVVLEAEAEARKQLERAELEKREATPPEAPKGAEAPQWEVEPEPPPTMPPACRVPELRGRTLLQARHRLHAAHCSLGKIVVRYRDGKVSSQRPRAGRKLAPGARVSVVLGH